MTGQQLGPGWWQGSDGRWYPPQPYPGNSQSNSSEKEPRSRSFREWIQTTQGVISLLVSIVALGGGGAAIAVHSGSSHGPSGPTASAPSTFTNPTSSTSQNPTGSASRDPTGVVSSGRLTQALLPAQVIGSEATVTGSGTDVSQLSGICGESIPSGAQTTAYESVRDSQTDQYLDETIVDWDNANDAGNAVIDARNTIDQTGSCSVSSNGVTESLIADNEGSPPAACANAQYLAAQTSIQSSFYNGFQVATQCGSFTVVIEILGGVGSIITQETADGYLSSAVGQLQKTTG